MADALTVFYLGQRSASRDHGEILGLLDLIQLERGEPDRNKRHLSSLLAAKSAAEYEERLMGESESIAALEHCRRFCQWAKSKLPG